MLLAVINLDRSQGLLEDRITVFLPSIRSWHSELTAEWIELLNLFTQYSYSILSHQSPHQLQYDVSIVYAYSFAVLSTLCDTWKLKSVLSYWSDARLKEMDAVSFEEKRSYHVQLKEIHQQQIKTMLSMLRCGCDFCNAIHYMPANSLLWAGKLPILLEGFFGTVSSLILLLS